MILPPRQTKPVLLASTAAVLAAMVAASFVTGCKQQESTEQVRAALEAQALAQIHALPQPVLDSLQYTLRYDSAVPGTPLLGRLEVHVYNPTAWTLLSLNVRSDNARDSYGIRWAKTVTINIAGLKPLDSGDGMGLDVDPPPAEATWRLVGGTGVRDSS